MKLFSLTSEAFQSYKGSTTVSVIFAFLKSFTIIEPLKRFGTATSIEIHVKIRNGEDKAIKDNNR